MVALLYGSVGLASKVLSRRLVASLSVLGLLLSTLLVVVPLTASAKSQPVKASSVSAASKSGITKSVRSGYPLPGLLSLQNLSAGVPQALRSPIPVRGGCPQLTTVSFLRVRYLLA